MPEEWRVKGTLPSFLRYLAAAHPHLLRGLQDRTIVKRISQLIAS
jgi:hypothetical protein